MPPLSDSSPSPYFIAIGASGSDGLINIRELLGEMPARLNGVLMVVLHRPSGQLSQLREILGRASALPVVIPSEDEQYETGNCYVGEPAEHLALAARSRVHLIEGTGDKFRNRTVDLLFSSLATHARERAIGVVLSGSLDDGSRGLAQIHRCGGETMVLRLNESAIKGMPENAIGYDGPVDFIGSIVDIARRICGRVKDRDS
jgi:two-component system, chemotaxis family, protein-glutamate methylesterase/glutaminase